MTRKELAGQLQKHELDEILKQAVEQGIEAGAKIGAEIGAKVAIRTMQKEKDKLKKQAYDKRYHNTKLLLRNYRTLNEHFRNAVYDLEQVEECDDSFTEIIELMSGYTKNEELYVNSIKNSAVRTQIIMTHVNRMLDIYKEVCLKGRLENKRRWNVVYSLYLSDKHMTADDIALMENIDRRTVYKDINACVSDLMILMFGIEGIEKLS